MKKKLSFIVTVFLLSIQFANAQAYYGQIVLFAGNFEPVDWAFCDGRLLSISQNTALFSLLGTTYGGNGRTTFALPDLRERVPVGSLQGPGLSDYPLGESGGATTVTLSESQMPAHAHGLSNLQVSCDNTTATSNSPVNTIPAIVNNGGNSYSTTKNAVMHSFQANVGISTVGGSQPHNNNKPYIAVNYIICLRGTFPPRN